MTKNTKQLVLWGVLIAGAGFLYLRLRGGSLGAMFGGGGAAAPGGSTGTTVNPSGGSGVATPAPIVTADIVAARGAATGPLSRHACALPKRWINTISPPYYGFCVTQAQFNEWTAQTDISEGTATDTYVHSYFGGRV